MRSSKGSLVRAIKPKAKHRYLAISIFLFNYLPTYYLPNQPTNQSYVAEFLRD